MTVHIVTAISDGLNFDGILEQYPQYTLFDILDAASDAVDFIDSNDSSSLKPYVRRVMVGISKGYGFAAIHQVCRISPLDIVNSACAILALHHTLSKPRKRKRKRRRISKRRLTRLKQS